MRFQRNYTQPDIDEHIIDGVLTAFLGFCDIPHGPGNEALISDHYAAQLRALGLAPVQDACSNVIADVPPTPGCEDAPLLALQGHMDMVLAVDEHSDFRPLEDGIIALVRDGKLCTNGSSSLGADCGIGNAALLYLLSHPHTAHGPLRLFFTTSEEIGLIGALQLEDTYIQDIKYLINVDGFTQGDLVISSSGGRRERYTRALGQHAPKGSKAWKLRLSGFLGGHSGYDINKDRANAIKIMTVFLSTLRQKMQFEIAGLRGGVSANAIPFACEVIIVASEEDEKTLQSACFRLSRQLLSMFSVTDPGGRAMLTPCALPALVWDDSSMQAALDLCILIYTGVYSMNAYVNDRVSSSSNLGLIGVNAANEIEVCSMVRCAVDANEEIIAMQHRHAAEASGFSMQVSGYPGWPGTTENRLARMMDRIYYRQTGKHMHITAMHAGLETSAFYTKKPEITIVSTGMTVYNPHSLDESVEIASIPPYVKLLHGALRAIGHNILP